MPFAALRVSVAGAEITEASFVSVIVNEVSNG